MVSLVICTYNRAQYLPKVLDSIKQQTCAVDQYEIVLINNNCTDNTEAICKSFERENPELKFNYLIESNQGLSYARNRGYKEAKYDIVAYLDDDAFIAKDYVEVMLHAFANNTIDALGGKILLSYEDTPPKWENKYVNSILGYFNKGDAPFMFTREDFPRGSNMVFHKQILEQVEGFNVRLGRTGGNMNGGEEKDIFNKIYDAKGRVMYAPDLIVYHTVPLFRTKIDFVKKQAHGIGVAERIRTLSISKAAFLFRILLELYKWIGTLFLFFMYTLKNQFDKGWFLIRFRIWVSGGLIFNKTN